MSRINSHTCKTLGITNIEHLETTAKIISILIKSIHPAGGSIPEVLAYLLARTAQGGPSDPNFDSFVRATREWLAELQEKENNDASRYPL